MHATTPIDSDAQEEASQLRMRILKLRWMGMEREAQELARSVAWPEAQSAMNAARTARAD